MKPEESGENEIGLFAALRGAAVFFVWIWRNKKTIAVLFPWFVLTADQFVGPHFIKRTWYSVRHTQAKESADAIAGSVVMPELQKIERGIERVSDEQILQRYAMEALPGGKHALKRAEGARRLDSLAASRWHSAKASSAETINPGNVAIIKAASIDPN